MRSRRKNMLVPAMLTVLVVGSGCASRGYVRTQVGEGADVLQASIHDNTEQIEMSSQDLNRLETETLEANRVQNDEIADTQNMIETTGNALATEVEQRVRQIDARAVPQQIFRAALAQGVVDVDLAEKITPEPGMNEEVVPFAMEHLQLSEELRVTLGQ